MSKKYRNEMHRINYLTSELESLYHQASIKFGICDSESIVLYSLLDAETDCLLSDIYKYSGVSKQTINSAIRKLESKEMIRLIPINGKSKLVSFTEKGRAFADKTVARLIDAELDAFEDWTEDEMKAHLNSMERYLEAFRKKIEEL